MEVEPRGSARYLQLHRLSCSVRLFLLVPENPYGVLLQFSTAAFSAALNFRDCPLAKSPSSSPPIATRTTRKTSTLSASTIPRICRFFPSWSTLSSHELRSPRPHSR